MSVQQSINSLPEITNLEDLTKVLSQTLSEISQSSAASGEWIPDIVTDYEGYTFVSSSYITVGNVVSFAINFTLLNSTGQITFGATTISTPNSDLVGTITASASYRTELSTLYSVLTSTTIVGSGTSSIVFTQESSGALASYDITIVGQYTIQQ